MTDTRKALTTDDIGDSTLKGCRQLDRREFIGRMALTAGVAPLLQGLPSPPPNVRVLQGPAIGTQKKAVLSAADFSYLGAMRLPLEGADLTFSYGAMTARRVNGRLHFFLTQSITGTFVPIHAVVEIADTEDYRSNYLDAPRAPIVQQWGDIYQGKRQSWLPDGTPHDLNGKGAIIGGLLYRDGRLYWSYNDWYNVVGRHDHHLGMTVLNSGPSTMKSYGPWRTTDGPHKLGQMLVAMPDGSLGMSATVMSGAVKSSWGPILKAGAPYPTELTPAGWKAPDINVPHRYVEHFYPTNDLTASGTLRAGGTLKSMARAGDYVWHAVSSSSGGDGSGNYLDPGKNDGRGSWTDVDNFSGITYIDLPTKHGVLFVGLMATGHVWYGLANNCGHGFGAGSHNAGTGPNASSFRCWWGIYDPAKMADVSIGKRTPNFPPDLQFDPTVAIAPMQLGSTKGMGGVYFDTVTSRLYVKAQEADSSVPGAYIPLIHVFQVKG